MAGTDFTVTDGFGRRVVFRGENLISDTTDTDDRRKPQWLDIDVWRTEAGSFVVKRAVRHRVVHRRENCPRLDGYDVVPSSGSYPCAVCNPGGEPGWGQAPRITVDVYPAPEELIESLKVDGKFTRLSRAILADLSEQDARVDALWNTVEVP